MEGPGRHNATIGFMTSPCNRDKGLITSGHIKYDIQFPRLTILAIGPVISGAAPRGGETAHAAQLDLGASSVSRHGVREISETILPLQHPLHRLKTDGTKYRLPTIDPVMSHQSLCHSGSP